MPENDNVDPNKVSDIADSLKEASPELKAFIEHLIEGIKGVKDFGTGLDKLGGQMKSAADTGAGFGETLAGIAGTNSGFNKSIRNVIYNLKDADKMFAGFTSSITANFNAMAVGISVVEKMFEATSKLVTSTDAAFVSFQKSTGAISTYGSEISAMEQELYNYGVTMDDAAESQGSLVTGMKNFDKLSSGARRDLYKTTSILAKMGVDSGITTANLNFMTNSMGMIPEAAGSAARSMMTLAKELETPPEAIAAAFKEAQPQLAAFGSRSTAVFQKLARNAHEATMEVNDILRITEQFDKFDTAASAVGKLNSALGGPYLSTIKMVTTHDPTDRMRMMAQATRDAGKSFDSMEYHERKMIAAAMGLKDVNELALVMAGEFDLAGGAVEMTTEQIIEQEKGLKSYNLIGEKFNQLWRTFAINIAGPIISGLKELADGLTYIAQKPMVWITSGLGLMTAALITFAVASGPLGWVSTLVVSLAAGFAVAAKGLYDLSSKSKPMLEIFSKVWGSISSRVAVLQENFAALFKGTGDIQGSFDSLVSDYGPWIEGFLMVVADLALNVAESFMRWAEVQAHFWSILMPFIKVIGGIAIANVAALVIAIMGLINAFVWLLNLVGEIYHFFFIGNSPSLIEVLGMLGSAITAVGNAFLYPIQMVGKMMSVLKDLAGLLAGKALSFLSGAMSYVFGTSTESQVSDDSFDRGTSTKSQVSNNSFDRGADMDRQAVSIGEEVAKAVKAALENTQLDNKVQLEIKSDRGLPSLFDYIIKGVDDYKYGRPVNHTLNASRAGLG